MHLTLLTSKAWNSSGPVHLLCAQPRPECVAAACWSPRPTSRLVIEGDRESDTVTHWPRLCLLGWISWSPTLESFICVFICVIYLLVLAPLLFPHALLLTELFLLPFHFTCKALWKSFFFHSFSFLLLYTIHHLWRFCFSNHCFRMDNESGWKHIICINMMLIHRYTWFMRL